MVETGALNQSDVHFPLTSTVACSGHGIVCVDEEIKMAKNLAICRDCISQWIFPFIFIFLNSN